MKRRRHRMTRTGRYAPLLGLPIVAALTVVGCSSASTPNASSSSPPSAATKSIVNIGVPMASSGIYQATYGSFPAVATAWEKWVNAHGGLNGHPVKLFIMDDGGDPSRTLSNITTMVDTDHVVAFAMVVQPQTSAVLAKFANEHHIPVIGDVGGETAGVTDPDWFEAESSATYGTAAAQLATAEYLTHASKLAVIYCLESPICKAGADVIQEYAPSARAKVVSAQAAATTTPDYTANILNIKQSGATDIITLVAENAAVLIAQAMQQQGYKGKLVESDTIASSEFLHSGSAVDGTIVSSHYPLISTPAWADARAAMAEYESGTPFTQLNAPEWAAGSLLELAGRDLPAHPTSQDLIDALSQAKNFTLDGLVPPETFPANGNKTKMNTCADPLIVENGALKPALGDETFICATPQGPKLVTSSLSG
jgi:branched-chain amino acid transport system substrate-binding protein